MSFKVMTHFDYSNLFLIKFYGVKIKHNNKKLNENSIKGTIITLMDAIIKKHILKHLKQFKKSIQKLLSKIAFNVDKKIMLYPYVFNQKDNFLYILFKMKALNGIIMPKAYFMFLNHRLQINFYFKMR